MGEAGKPVLFEGFQGSCHVVLRGRRGTLWHFNLFDNMWKTWKLEEVSYEMLVFLHSRVLSPVSGFPVASPCLWGELEMLCFLPFTALFRRWWLRATAAACRCAVTREISLWKKKKVCEQCRCTNVRLSQYIDIQRLSQYPRVKREPLFRFIFYLQHTCEHSGSWASSCCFVVL